MKTDKASIRKDLGKVEHKVWKLWKDRIKANGIQEEEFSQVRAIIDALANVNVELSKLDRLERGW